MQSWEASIQVRQVEDLRADLKAKEAAFAAVKTTQSKTESERQVLLAELARVQRNITESSLENAETQKQMTSMNSAITLAGKVRYLIPYAGGRLYSARSHATS